MGTFVCICCQRRRDDAMQHTVAGDLGVCRDCWEQFYRTPAELFTGTEHTEFLIAPFYYGGAAKQVIMRYKFQNQRAYRAVLAALTGQYAARFDILHTYDTIISIPLSRKRFFERGYNQADLIAAPLAERLGLEHLQNGVFRSRNTQAQSTLKGAMRRENVKGAFIADPRKIQGRNIVLFDDVFTMGMTMEACAKELREKGAAKVAAMSLAVVRDPRIK